METRGELTTLLPGYHRPFFSPALFRPDPSVGKTMPESPADSKFSRTSPSVITPIMPPVSSSTAPLTLRPLSTSSSMSGTLHSPHSSLSGRTPSPPTSQAQQQQQLPPACGARQLSKLKRFLTTLIQFGSDISPEIGDRVRSLVLALVNNHLSIEEFHAKLQEATNFPLRPFVIPFLKANLPLLQRELLHCARMAKQTPQQYLAHNEHLIFDPAHSPFDPAHDLSSSAAVTGVGAVASDNVNENGKRRGSPDRPKENGYSDHEPPAKRPSPVTSVLPPGGGNSNPTHFHSPPPPSSSASSVRAMEDLSRESRHFNFPNFPSSTALAARSPMASASAGTAGGDFPNPRSYERHIDHHIDRIEDEWRHVENMLHCIMDMVGRCRRALTALQEKAQHDREDLATWMRRHGSGLDSDMKKRADMMADSLRHAEDRVNEVRRRAVYDFPEEAVAEVKRQAVAELQKAVAAAEAKAAELVAAERSKMDTAIDKARKEAADEVMSRLNHQEESSESCWNCGRKAHETCSGCNIARYCGPFCQHKDWESHHRVCVPRPPPQATEIRPVSSSPTSAAPIATPMSPAGSPPTPALGQDQALSSPKAATAAVLSSPKSESGTSPQPVQLKEEPKSTPEGSTSCTSESTQ